MVVGSFVLAFTVHFAFLHSREPFKDEFTLSKAATFAFGALTFGRRWSVTPLNIPSR